MVRLRRERQARPSIQANKHTWVWELNRRAASRWSLAYAEYLSRAEAAADPEQLQ